MAKYFSRFDSISLPYFKELSEPYTPAKSMGMGFSTINAGELAVLQIMERQTRLPEYLSALYIQPAKRGAWIEAASRLPPSQKKKDYCLPSRTFLEARVPSNSVGLGKGKKSRFRPGFFNLDAGHFPVSELAWWTAMQTACPDASELLVSEFKKGAIDNQMYQKLRSAKPIKFVPIENQIIFTGGSLGPPKGYSKMRARTELGPSEAEILKFAKQIEKALATPIASKNIGGSKSAQSGVIASRNRALNELEDNVKFPSVKAALHILLKARGKVPVIRRNTSIPWGTIESKKELADYFHDEWWDDYRGKAAKVLFEMAKFHKFVGEALQKEAEDPENLDSLFTVARAFPEEKKWHLKIISAMTRSHPGGGLMFPALESCFDSYLGSCRAASFFRQLAVESNQEKVMGTLLKKKLEEITLSSDISVEGKLIMLQGQALFDTAELSGFDKFLANFAKVRKGTGIRGREIASAAARLLYRIDCSRTDYFKLILENHVRNLPNSARDSNCVSSWLPNFSSLYSSADLGAKDLLLEQLKLTTVRVFSENPFPENKKIRGEAFILR